MAKRVEVRAELTAEELRERYRKASEPVERTHWHILWLMKEGHPPKEVAQRVGYTTRLVFPSFPLLDRLLHPLVSHPIGSQLH
jgi:hypothetical protein